MKKVFFITIIVSLLNSCSSSDENPDMIIGQWQMIERYESDLSVGVGCSQYYYTEFKSNNELSGGYIDSNDTPAECSSIFDLSLWRRSGGDYEIYSSPNDVQSIAYFQGDNLVIEPTSADYRWVYQRL